MLTPPLLSIIIPCYNADKTISETLECFITQFRDFNDYEIITVDDGSVDDTTNILKGYSERNPNIKFLQKNNGGVSSTRNLGLSKASGQYVWFFDADDLLFDNSLPNILDILESRHPDILRVNSVTVDKKTAANMDSLNNSSSFRILYDGKYGHFLSSHPVGFSCWSLIVSREILTRSGIIFDTHLSIHEDVAWNLKLAKVHPDASFLFISLRTIKYMVRAGSLVNTVNPATNKKHLISSLEFYNYLDQDIWTDFPFLSLSIQNYKTNTVRQIITKHLSCKFSFKENRFYLNQIKPIIIHKRGG